MPPPKPAPELTVVSPASLRAALRRDCIAARVALPAAEHQRLSGQIETHLAALLARQTPQILGFCWPYRAEFDCRPLVRQLLAAKPTLRACLPVVIGPGQPLVFRAWTADSPMQTDRHGIPYPASGASLIPDVLLIPVNAFDAQGYRLGYGSGYFDRTLAALHPRPLAIGIGFELGKVASIQPAAHDIPLDAVITEAGVHVCSPRMAE
ncbi:MAG: 5-formyltetrahydrofolate cyclo-ligase [Sterolibacterium sp.]|nr:5-formyltetrahydrofolate cyclo-ligase [Sterolibacterium sp.]